MLVLELRTGNHPVHSGVLGQLNIFQQECKRQYPGVEVKSALVTTTPIDDPTLSLARTFHLGVFPADSEDQLEGDFADFLRSPSVSPQTS
jgi:hypothetical protein